MRRKGMAMLPHRRLQAYALVLAALALLEVGLGAALQVDTTISAETSEDAHIAAADTKQIGSRCPLDGVTQRRVSMNTFPNEYKHRDGAKVSCCGSGECPHGPRSMCCGNTHCCAPGSTCFKSSKGMVCVTEVKPDLHPAKVEAQAVAHLPPKTPAPTMAPVVDLNLKSTTPGAKYPHWLNEKPTRSAKVVSTDKDAPPPKAFFLPGKKPSLDPLEESKEEKLNRELMLADGNRAAASNVQRGEQIDWKHVEHVENRYKPEPDPRAIEAFKKHGDVVYSEGWGAVTTPAPAPYEPVDTQANVHHKVESDMPLKLDSKHMQELQFAGMSADDEKKLKEQEKKDSKLESEAIAALMAEAKAQQAFKDAKAYMEEQKQKQFTFQAAHKKSLSDIKDTKSKLEYLEKKRRRERRKRRAAASKNNAWAKYKRQKAIKREKAAKVRAEKRRKRMEQTFKRRQRRKKLKKQANPEHESKRKEATHKRHMASVARHSSQLEKDQKESLRLHKKSLEEAHTKWKSRLISHHKKQTERRKKRREKRRRELRKQEKSLKKLQKMQKLHKKQREELQKDTARLEKQKKEQEMKKMQHLLKRPRMPVEPQAKKTTSSLRKVFPKMGVEKSRKAAKAKARERRNKNRRLQKRRAKTKARKLRQLLRRRERAVKKAQRILKKAKRAKLTTKVALSATCKFYGVYKRSGKRAYCVEWDRECIRYKPETREYSDGTPFKRYCEAWGRPLICYSRVESGICKLWNLQCVKERGSGQMTSCKKFGAPWPKNSVNGKKIRAIGRKALGLNHPKKTAAPTSAPTHAPTPAPTAAPTNAPTNAPTPAPTPRPTVAKVIRKLKKQRKPIRLKPPPVSRKNIRRIAAGGKGRKRKNKKNGIRAQERQLKRKKSLEKTKKKKSLNVSGSITATPISTKKTRLAARAARQALAQEKANKAAAKRKKELAKQKALAQEKKKKKRKPKPKPKLVTRPKRRKPMPRPIKKRR